MRGLPGKQLELFVEMRLVKIAGAVGGIGETAVNGIIVNQPAEPYNTGKLLGTGSRGLPESFFKRVTAGIQIFYQILYPDIPMRLLYFLHRRMYQQISGPFF